jgi:hypothetical protein
MRIRVWNTNAGGTIVEVVFEGDAGCRLGYPEFLPGHVDNGERNADPAGAFGLAFNRIHDVKMLSDGNGIGDKVKFLSIHP